MGLHTAFTALAEVIDAYESRGRSIQTVEASPADSGDAVIDVTIAMPVSLRSGGGDDQGLSPTAARVTDSGDLQVEFASPVVDPPSPTGASVSVVEAAAAVAPEGLRLTLQLTIDATGTSDGCGTGGAAFDHEAALERAVQGDDTNVSESHGSEGDPSDDEGSTAETDQFADVRDESVPPYEDTEYLQALYDECDNFTQIAQQIQMDVSSETVRRYMIEADIHVPNSYDTSGSDDEAPSEADTEDEAARDVTEAEDGRSGAAEPAAPEPSGAAEESVTGLPDEQLVTDGIGLPADVQLHHVADAVVDSDTVYEVQRHLGLDRGRTRDLLEQLNLLDLVLCRLTDNPEHAASYETVAGRIRQCTPRTA